MITRVIIATQTELLNNNVLQVGFQR